MGVKATTSTMEVDTLVASFVSWAVWASLVVIGGRAPPPPSIGGARGVVIGHVRV